MFAFLNRLVWAVWATLRDGVRALGDTSKAKRPLPQSLGYPTE